MPVVKTIKYSNDSEIAIWSIEENANELIQYFEKSSLPKELFHFKELRKKQWLSSRLALYALEKNLKLIHHTEKKKIEVQNQDLFISVSHCENISVSLINRKENCGIDVQKYSPKLELVKNKFLSETEQSLLNSQLLKYNECITIYWSCKEALFKKYAEHHLAFKDNIEILKTEIFENEIQVFCIVKKENLFEFETVNVISYNEFFICIV